MPALQLLPPPSPRLPWLPWGTSALVHGLTIFAAWLMSMLLVDWRPTAAVARGRPLVITVAFAPAADAEQVAEMQPVRMKSVSRSEQKSISREPRSAPPVPNGELPSPTAVAREVPAEQPPEETPRDVRLPRTMAAAAPAVTTTVDAVGAAVDEQPQPLADNPPPAYPADALAAKQEGRVTLRALVTAQGSVERIAIERTSGTLSLDRAAIAAVMGWRFRPAKRRGLAVAAEVLVPVRFVLQPG